MKPQNSNPLSLFLVSGAFFFSASGLLAGDAWVVDSHADWNHHSSRSTGILFEDGYARLEGKSGTYQSSVYTSKQKKKTGRIEFAQSPEWMNWDPVGEVGPPNIHNAPVFLCLGDNDYWMFGLYRDTKDGAGFESSDVALEGFDVLLKTTQYENLYIAPGGLGSSKFGCHAWQSRDMENWVYHGRITQRPHRCITSAEYADGKVYIYYDFPNDQDPHLYIDSDLTDGKPGESMGLAFADPSDGSDCGIIRDLEGNFHIIYEDWSPINASTHSWDSPLGGHAVSKDGKGDFRIVSPSVDHRTTPTGAFKEYTHPHWAGHPDWDNGIAKYEVH